MRSYITGSTIGINLTERTVTYHSIAFLFVFILWVLIFLIYLKYHSPRNSIKGTNCYPKDKNLKAAGCGQTISSPLFCSSCSRIN
jgi:hypothetical protein